MGLAAAVMMAAMLAVDNVVMLAVDSIDAIMLGEEKESGRVGLVEN